MFDEKTISELHAALQRAGDELIAATVAKIEREAAWESLCIANIISTGGYTERVWWDAASSTHGKEARSLYRMAELDLRKADIMYDRAYTCLVAALRTSGGI